MIVQVAVPSPFLFPLDYVFDIEDSPLPVVGGRVLVPFRNKQKVGLVISLSNNSNYNKNKLKSIVTVIDEHPLYSKSHLDFIYWAARYYHEPIGEVVQAALPKKLRIGESVEVSGQPAWELSDQGLALSMQDLPKNAKHQAALLSYLQKVTSPQTARQISLTLENWRASLKKFQQQGWIKETYGSCLPTLSYGNQPNHVLNNEQKNAIDAVTQLPENTYQTFLLEGVTGSGKTEVYLGMINEVLKRGKQALVLVPEIGLTPQMVERFTSYLQQPVATLHSGLNDSERLCAWNLVRKGEIKVLLGTRSAIFTPFANLGICIIDEEHDLSFKQQDGFRYSARDLLIRRALVDKVPVVLGSATPSLESLHNAYTGRYFHLMLNQRAANAVLPSIKLLDIRGEKIQEGVSRPLKTAIHKHLEQDGQILLFLNRRGFSPVLMCHECGWQAKCPSCDANMTFHQSGTKHGHLRCHHCGYQSAAPKHCPSCHSEEFVKIGQGTERLAETIKSWFPDRNVVRIDRDTTRKKGSMDELTAQARSGEADILVGTQMLAKGHHFPRVTLVGLIDVDQGLFSVDFRASERMAQLILQVAGRSGRGDKKGEVLIQTHHPDHPLLITLINHGYSSFARKALLERQNARLPPFRFQVMFRAESLQPQEAMQFLTDLKHALNAFVTELQLSDISIWGAVVAPMERRQGRYRYQLLLQSSTRSAIQELLVRIEPQIHQSQLSRKVRWSLDVDPLEMF